MHGANVFYPETAVFLGSDTPRQCRAQAYAWAHTGGGTVHLRAYAGPFLMIYAARAFVGLGRVGRIVDLALLSGSPSSLFSSMYSCNISAMPLFFC